MLAGRFLMASLMYPDSLCYVKARMTIERQTVRELRDKLRQVGGRGAPTGRRSARRAGCRGRGWREGEDGS